MIRINRLEDISESNKLSMEMKTELKGYFREIAEGIVGEEWKEYNLSEVGPILVLEDQDTAEALDEYGLMQGSKSIPEALPEFALRANVGGVEMFKIIWVCNDSFGLSVYYPKGKFGQEFDEWVQGYLC